MTARRNFFVGMACLLLVLTSCADSEVYYRFHHLEKGKWYQDSVLVFTIDSALLHPGNPYSLFIELTTNRGYSYRDLWLRVDHNLTDTLFHSDTLHVEVSDEQGRWLGSGAGGLNQLSVPYLKHVHPAVRDSVTGYRVMIRQTMSDNPLQGVEKIGLKVIGNE